MSTISVKHSINSGDLISSLPGLQHVYNKLGKKSKIYQRLNLPAQYYEGASHPVKQDGIHVTMNERQLGLLKPLLEYQDYIESVDEWVGQAVDFDFDIIREGIYSTMPFGSINRWIWYAHPLLACDLSEKWLKVPELTNDRYSIKDKIIINLTSRYRNDLITYYFLKKWEDRIVFSGVHSEYVKFKEDYKLEVPILETKDFLELAQYIANCKLYIGNQSMGWHIADALKVTRLLEVCRAASNCPPNGANGYDYLQQGALEIYVNKFMK
jgi:hypothetical protein